MSRSDFRKFRIFSVVEEDGNGIKLTDAGTVFYKTAVDIVSMYDDTLKRCKVTKDRCVLHVTNFMSLCPTEFFNLCTDFQFKHPEIEIKFENSDFTKVFADVASGDIHLSTSLEVNDRFPGACNFLPIREENYCLLALGSDDNSDLRNSEIILRTNEIVKLDSLKHCGDMNITVIEQGKSFGAQDFMNDLFAGKTAMVPAPLCEQVPGLVRKVPLDIPAGKYGFIVDKNPTEWTMRFIEMAQTYVA